MRLVEWLFRRAELKAAYRRIAILEVSVDYLRATIDLNAQDGHAMAVRPGLWVAPDSQSVFHRKASR